MHEVGCIFAKKDIRNYKLSKSAKKKIELPKEFKLEPSKILNQGSVSSCVAHATASTVESIYSNDFSVGWIYGNRNDDYFGKGMTIPDALKTANKKGCVLRKDFDVNEEILDIIKTVEQNKTILEPLAEPYKIGLYARLETLDEIKIALLKGIPVIFACDVKEDYLSMNDEYVINVTKDKNVGGHAMMIYGWNEKGWLIQNSWGEEWGNHGCAILPYNYLIKEAYAIEKPIKDLEDEEPIIVKPKLYWLREFIMFFVKLFRKIFAKK